MLKKYAKIVFVMVATFLFYCDKTKIFTEIDFTFDEIEDAFPEKFAGNKLSLRNINKKTTQKVFEKGLLGLYGSIISLEVIQCKTKKQCRANFDKEHKILRKVGFEEFDLTQTGEAKLSYVAKDKIAGLVWTNKSFLFNLEAKTKKHLLAFLKSGKIAKIE